jgi:hypothetical protein
MHYVMKQAADAAKLGAQGRAEVARLFAQLREDYLPTRALALCEHGRTHGVCRWHIGRRARSPLAAPCACTSVDSYQTSGARLLCSGAPLH